MQKVCALCDTKFSNMPKRTPVQVVSIDGNPVPADTVLMLSQRIVDQLNDLVDSTRKQPDDYLIISCS